MDKFGLVLIILLSSIINTSNGAEMYLSVDAQGNIVFSDKPPEVGEFEAKEQEEIPTVSWTQLKVTPTKHTKKSKVNQKRLDKKNSKQEVCANFNQQVIQAESKLKSRLKPEAFERYKKQLAKTRRKYRKRCK